MFSVRFQDIGAAFRSTTYTNKTALLSEDTALQAAFEMLTQLRDRKGIAYVIGNGGSAGIASHFSTDLIKALKIPSATLFDSNIMTCLSNDYGYEEVFSYQLFQIMKSQDLLIAISSSGKSPNIIKAANVALQKGAPCITLSGFQKENPLRTLGDLNFWVDRSDYGLVETVHFILLHSIVDMWNQQSKVKEYARILGPQTAKQN